MDSLTDIISGLAELRPTLAEFYQDLHRHPELSMEETRTAAKAAERLRADGYQVTAGVGKTGVVGILEHGSGPTVMLRADMDALPVREQTGLAYASNVTAIDSEGQTVPVMHACGHDFHVTCLSGAASLLSSKRKRWSGRLMVVFQPAEETASGARAMLDDGLFDRFGNPDIILGQHVAPTPAGMLVWRAGVSMAAADSLEIVLFGRGGHSSRPQTCVDPVVMAAAVVMRLQGIVSREVAPDEQ
ncbi:MAG TPA: amidohydrolase, partial [Candidatus Binataceae bacterium]|nr:amidohydrolase [Candidatus Binataceae bacterium]